MKIHVQGSNNLAKSFFSANVKQSKHSTYQNDVIISAQWDALLGFFKGKQFIEKNPYISSILQPQSGQRTSFKSTLLLKVSKNRNGLSEVSLHLHQKQTKIFLYFYPEEKSILGKIVCDICDLFISKFCPTQLSQHTKPMSTFRTETPQKFRLYFGANEPFAQTRELRPFRILLTFIIF